MRVFRVDRKAPIMKFTHHTAPLLFVSVKLHRRQQKKERGKEHAKKGGTRKSLSFFSCYQRIADVLRPTRLTDRGTQLYYCTVHRVQLVLVFVLFEGIEGTAPQLARRTRLGGIAAYCPAGSVRAVPSSSTSGTVHFFVHVK